MRYGFILILLGLALPAAAVEYIELLTYHNHPPFIDDRDSGESYRLAERLNALAPPQLRFVVNPLPRVRLNQRLQDWIDGNCPAAACDTGWVVPWVNPKWGFRPEGRDPYQWIPMIKDANVILSRRDAPVHYRQPASLDGKVLAAMRGHRYVGIDERVAQGRIERIDGNVERDNLLMLLYRRVDAVLLPESTVNYFLRHDPLLAARAGELYVAPVYHQRYERFAMVPAEREDLQQLLRQALGQR